MVATGLPASPGAAVGKIVFSADDAEAWHAQGKSVILVCFSYFMSTVIILIFLFSGNNQHQIHNYLV